MDGFLQALTSLGVAPFTALTIAALLYWLMVILGALDIDLLHVGHHHEVSVHHGDAGDHPHPGWATGLLEFLSVGKVPLTVIVSLLVFISWSVAMGLVLTLHLWSPLVFVGGLAAATPLTALLCRPLRQVFNAIDHGVIMGVAMLGREARITSAVCTAAFGTATCDVGDAEILLRVVASRSELVFQRDEVVVIADHDAERDCYIVGPATYREEPAPVVVDTQVSPMLPSSSAPTSPKKIQLPQ